MKSKPEHKTLAEYIRSKEFENNVTRPLARTAKTTAKGLASWGDLAALPINTASQMAGYGDIVAMPSETIGNLFDTYTNGLTQPQNFLERASDTAGEFAASGGVPKAALAAGNTAKWLAQLSPNNFRELASAVSAGAGFEAGREMYPNNPLAQIASSIAAGFAPGAAINATKAIKSPVTTTQNKLASLAEINPQKVDSFKRADLQPTLSNISDSKPIGTTENMIRELPFVNKSLSKITDKARNAIEKLDSGLTQEGAGSLAQEGLRQYGKKEQKLIENLKADTAKYIAPDSDVKIPSLLKTIKDRPKLFTEERRKAFANSVIGKKYNEIISTAGVSDSYPYADLVDLRQEIDNAVSTFGQYGSKEQGALKNLRNHINADIRSHLEANNPQGLKAFDRYNKVTHQIAKRREDVVDGLLNNKTVTETFKKIRNNLNVDARDAEVVLNTLKPEQKKIFSQSLIRELGMTQQNDFRGAQLATNFKKLEPKAQEVVLSSFTPKEREQFRGVVDAIDAIKDTQALGNPSRTAYTIGIAGLAGKLAAGDFITAAKTLAELAGVAAGGSALFANPKFINWLSAAPKLKNVQQFEQHIGGLSEIAKSNPELVPALSNFLKSLSQEGEQETDPLYEDLQKMSSGELKALLSQGEKPSYEELNTKSTEELKAMLRENKGSAVDDYLLEKNKNSDTF